MTWNSASGEMVFFFSFCPWLSATSTFRSSSVIMGPSDRPAERVSRLLMLFCVEDEAEEAVAATAEEEEEDEKAGEEKEAMPAAATA